MLCYTYSFGQYFFREDTIRKCFEIFDFGGKSKKSKLVKLQNKVICVDSSIRITGNTIIQDCELKISPNVSIVVLPNSQLSISGSHLYSCNDMWSGIVVQNNGTLNISGSAAHPSSLIEDAVIAVEAIGNGTLTSGTAFRISNSIFNRNGVDIYLHDYQRNIASYPFFINGNVFTCRDIPFTANTLVWPSVGAVSASVVPTNPLQSPYINNAVYSATNAAAYLKPPMSGQKSQVGIKMKNVGYSFGTFTVGGMTYREIVIGGSIGKGNIFDNKIYGIDAFNANFTSYDNIYQNMVQTGKGGSVGSIGIQAVADNGVMGNLNIDRIRVIPTNTMTGAGNNKFYDCSTAMKVDNYSEMEMSYNEVRSTQVNSAPVVLINHTGLNGISCRTGKFLMCNINNNKLYNIENGIIFIASVVTSTNTSIPSQQRSGQLNIQNNVIQPHLPGYTITSQYVSNGIYAASILLAAPQYSTIGTTSVVISGNKISDVWRGIYTANWYKKDIRVQSNCITLRNDSYGNIQYGIESANNIPMNSFGVLMYNNSVSGPVGASAKMKGIWVSMSTQNAVRCNSVSSVSNGIEYSGTSAPCQFMGNMMQNCSNGYVLSNNAIIGQQGSAGQPSDNRWVGSMIFRTFVDASNSLFSVLYVRNNPPIYNPLIGPAGFASGGVPYTSFGAVVYTTGPSLVCPPIGPCNNIVPPPPIVTLVPPPFNNPNIAVLEKIAQNQIPAFSDTATSRFINQNHLFRTLLATPSLTTASGILQQFLTQNQLALTNKEKFNQIETDINSGNFTAAQSKITSVNPQNTAESNHKLFYDIYLRYLQNGAISANDSSSIWNIANGCPYKDGSVVYQARAMWNMLNENIVVFEDNCTISDAGSKLNYFQQHENKRISSDEINIYPNPNNGSFVVMVSERGVYKIEVTDVSGKLLLSEERYITDKTEMKLNVKAGVYFMRIYDENKKMTVKKVVVE